MGIGLDQPRISCTRRMSTPYSSPSTMKVSSCSLSEPGLPRPSNPAAIGALLSRGARARGPLPRELADATDVQDERDGAVAQDGGPGEPHHVLVVVLQVLHHHLLLRQELVDQETQLLPVGVDDDHQPLAAG